ncbi:(2Fe-2S)-binding protein [Devosia sp. WQ 349]|uniref:(2Fe-2S)-binding protein n=1 Tax=Devosia sp. WQ 349K1 TaxID=2800329 RepID=UPI0019073206|nr:(2Fe-2S)-binding protein [Devosia sp. WQ 349K1]MBK1796177.1 (2Fe-2S)-binding protein [Devosia sp. WQ 349K1]
METTQTILNGSRGLKASTTERFLEKAEEFYLQPSLVVRDIGATWSNLDGWITQQQLSDANDGPLPTMLEELQHKGFGRSRKGAAASLLLRTGWAAGLPVAAHLLSQSTISYHRFALKFSSSTLLQSVGVEGLEVDDSLLGDVEARRAAVAKQLLMMSADTVEALHRWSNYSYKALWSMVSSSWAAQIYGMCEALGQEERAQQEADEIIRLTGIPTSARPKLYSVKTGGQNRVCQRRAACCLYYKSEKNNFCASCPLVPELERLQRNADWVSQRAI